MGLIIMILFVIVCFTFVITFTLIFDFLKKYPTLQLITFIVMAGSVWVFVSITLPYIFKIFS